MLDSECKSIWNSCLKIISAQIKHQSYITWFAKTEGLDIEGNIVRISVPNKFVSEWLEEHYNDIILSAINDVTKCKMNIVFKPRDNDCPVIESPPERIGMSIKQPPRQRENSYIRASNLHERYSFTNFVVGESNQFAHAAAMAVSESPGKTKFNPFCIYGSVGLGKTHLAQAIGNFVLDIYPGTKVLYTTSEKFTSDFINSISSSSTKDFVNFYRNADVLLLDDIQFLAGKESTQEQFFHTFNTLHETGKQIVLTADRSPKDIEGLEERLLSRFTWGLVTDIQPPDLETRMAILQKKSEADGLYIQEDVIQYIAENVTNSIRDLEGSLIQLLAYSSITCKDINFDVAVNVLKNTIPEKKRNITIETIRVKVAESYGVPEEMLNAKKKTRELVTARQVAMYLSRKFTGASLKIIGLKFGGRDHSTVIHAINQVNEQRKASSVYKSKIDNIINSLY